MVAPQQWHTHTHQKKNVNISTYQQHMYRRITCQCASNTQKLPTFPLQLCHCCGSLLNRSNCSATAPSSALWGSLSDIVVGQFRLIRALRWMFQREFRQNCQVHFLFSGLTKQILQSLHIGEFGSLKNQDAHLAAATIERHQTLLILVANVTASSVCSHNIL